MSKFLIIQTAFIGDVVLATAIAEKLHDYFPEATIDFLLRKGNETLLKDHPYIKQIFLWDKQNQKKRNLFRILRRVRKEKYTHVINLHRFGSSGFITAFSGAKHRIGFDKNPFAFFYTKKVNHIISEPYSTHVVHEVERNQMLIESFTDNKFAFPKLYPDADDFFRIRTLQNDPYICIAPASVWFTKQFPTQKWIELLDALPPQYRVYLIGGVGDDEMAKGIIRNTLHRNVTSICGSISYVQSAALMQGAVMNYVNDSAPLHFATAVNAPVTAVFCSTVPAFGFGPLRENGRVVEINERLSCRPCGLHGHTACPEGHFRCALEIKKEQLLWWTSKTT